MQLPLITTVKARGQKITTHAHTRICTVQTHANTHSAGCRQAILAASSVTRGEIRVKVNLSAKAAAVVMCRQQHHQH